MSLRILLDEIRAHYWFCDDEGVCQCPCCGGEVPPVGHGEIGFGPCDEEEVKE